MGLFNRIAAFFDPWRETKLTATRLMLVDAWDVGMYATERVGQRHPSIEDLVCVRCDVVGLQGDRWEIVEHYEGQ